MIICFCEDLWVINGVLTNKNIFDTNNVVYRVGGGPTQNNSRKNSRFDDQRIIGYKNYGVKILQMIFLLLFGVLKFYLDR